MISPIQLIRMTQYDNLYAGMDDGQDKFLIVAGFDGGTGQLPYFVNVFSKGCLLFQITDGTWFRNTAASGLTPVWSAAITADLVVSGTMTSADILQLNSSPFQVLPISGVGFGYLVTFVKAKLNAGGTSYTVPGASFMRLIAGTTVFAQYQGGTFVGSATDAVNASVTGGIVGFRMQDNAALFWEYTGSDPTLGDGTIDYEIHFRYVTL